MIKPADENVRSDGTEIAGTDRTLLEHEKKPKKRRVILEYWNTR